MAHYRLIVIGSGISGLFAALEARTLGPVLVLTKGSVDDCNTRWAQGGIAAAVGPLDSPAQHFADTVAAGSGLVDTAAAGVLCNEAPARIRDLVEYGVAFDSLNGEAALGREAAHGRARVLHAGGDRTGAVIETALARAVATPSITVLDFTMVTSIIVENGVARGVRAIDMHNGNAAEYTAPAVVIATGGAGQLYSHTTNPEVATGDGIALAFEAGAELADLEFYQFHPTAFRSDGAPPFLISEAVRGEGAVLRNANGEPFMARYHEMADLAPRDIVARAIVAEMRASGVDQVELDCTQLKGVEPAARFPGIDAFCRSQGIDMSRELIPVAPAAHYLMGGVRTDTWGRTAVPGLFAVGEVACTGVHGANRLASNSLMETVVFGKRMVEVLPAAAEAAPADPEAAIFEDTGGPAPGHVAVQKLMWEYAGIERHGDGLAQGLRVARAWPAGDRGTTRAASEEREMALVARLMLQAAWQRTESRGAHFRSDFPQRDDERWLHRQVFRRAP